MSTDFASAIVGTINNRQGLQSQIDYYISKMCPELLRGSLEQRGGQADIPRSSQNYCALTPWDKECQNNSGATDPGACDKRLVQYRCSYTKYLDATPSVKAWATANPHMAQQEAKRLKASDADKLSLDNLGTAKPGQASTIQAAAEEKCLKASDYKGCMNYQLNKSSKP